MLPFGALEKSAFSCGGGAWSVAIASMVPSRSPSITAKRSASACARAAHPEIASRARKQGVGQAEIMRCCLRRHLHTPALCIPNHSHRRAGTHMTDMDRDLIRFLPEQCPCAVPAVLGRRWAHLARPVRAKPPLRSSGRPWRGQGPHNGIPPAFPARRRLHCTGHQAGMDNRAPIVAQRNCACLRRAARSSNSSLCNPFVMAAAT